MKCQRIAEKEQLELRQSYKFTIKKLSAIQRLRRNKDGAGKARKASKKIKTIPGGLLRELERMLSGGLLDRYSAELLLFSKVLAQKRTDTNKSHSLHEPDVKCYTKGKEHKKFEFGSKASFWVTQSTGCDCRGIKFYREFT